MHHDVLPRGLGGRLEGKHPVAPPLGPDGPSRGDRTMLVIGPQRTRAAKAQVEVVGCHNHCTGHHAAEPGRARGTSSDSRIPRRLEPVPVGPALHRARAVSTHRELEIPPAPYRVGHDLQRQYGHFQGKLMLGHRLLVVPSREGCRHYSSGTSVRCRCRHASRATGAPWRHASRPRCRRRALRSRRW